MSFNLAPGVSEKAIYCCLLGYFCCGLFMISIINIETTSHNYRMASSLTAYIFPFLPLFSPTSLLWVFNIMCRVLIIGLCSSEQPQEGATHCAEREVHTKHVSPDSLKSKFLRKLCLKVLVILVVLTPHKCDWCKCLCSQGVNSIRELIQMKVLFWVTFWLDWFLLSDNLFALLHDAWANWQYEGRSKWPGYFGSRWQLKELD